MISNDSITGYDVADQQNAMPPYHSNDILTDELAEILLDASKNHKELNIHFEDNLITICYFQKKDLFEPHFKYGFCSREKVGTYIQKELDISFAIFDKLLPVFDSLSLK